MTLRLASVLRVPGLLIAVLLVGVLVAPARAEILVRWDQPQVPARMALGIDALVIPIEQPDAIRDAARKGYRVFVEIDASRGGDHAIPPAARGGVVVRGDLSEDRMRRLRAQIADPGARVLTIDPRGTWPHLRLNAVTSRDGVLQIASRTAQPWLESNHALARIAGLTSDSARALSYEWRDASVAGTSGPRELDDYLVAIADAGSIGASLVLPLDPRFQRALLRGLPDARRDWQAIRDSMAFYAWEAPRRYEPLVDVAVVVADPFASYEALNLLARHNVAFGIVPAAGPATGTLPPLVIVLDPPARAIAAGLEAHEAAGGEVLRLDEPVLDPNAFALDVRNRLGPARRSVDVWNGITVLLTSWRDAADGTVLIELVNYARVPRPVQVRVRGTFAAVHVEAPGEEPRLIPLVHRGGATEVVVPSVRTGARLVLTTRVAGSEDESARGAARQPPDGQ
jgi:hypothetical protein